MGAIDNVNEGTATWMPINIDRQSRVTFGGGRKQ